MKKFLTIALAVFILLSCVRVNHKVVFEDENISCDGVVRRGLFDSKFYGVVQYKDSGAVITAFDDRTALLIENEKIRFFPARFFFPAICRLTSNK